MRQLLYFASLFTICNLSHAEERPIREVNPPIREMSMNESLSIQQKRALREKDASQHPEKYREAKKSPVKSAKKMVSVDKTSHMGAYHHPVLISPLGDAITTEDGAVYSVHTNDRFKTYNWLTSDALKVTPNHAWFSSYAYRMTNLNTTETVEVNIATNPIFNGICTHWIIAIDLAQGQICLEDGTVWHLSGFDYSVYKKWFINDTIIIGHNDGFFSSSKPNILINCNIVRTPYVEARCIN